MALAFPIEALWSDKLPLLVSWTALQATGARVGALWGCIVGLPSGAGLTVTRPGFGKLCALIDDDVASPAGDSEPPPPSCAWHEFENAEFRALRRRRRARVKTRICEGLLR